jgi:hypothetical protein
MAADVAGRPGNQDFFHQDAFFSHIIQPKSQGPNPLDRHSGDG